LFLVGTATVITRPEGQTKTRYATDWTATVITCPEGQTKTRYATDWQCERWYCKMV